MEYVKLGRTGLKVSRICLGTNMFGASYVDDARAISVVDECYEQGINFIDSADLYTDGRSEEVVGKAIKGKRHDTVLGTKGFFPTGPGVNDTGLSRKHLMDAVEASLRRLGTDYIDLYQVHWWDSETPIEETLRTLDDLVHQGKIRYLGCSHFAAWQLCKSIWASDKHGLERFESIQPEYSFLCLDIEEEIVPLCEDQQIAVLPYQVLGAGLLVGNYDRNSEPPQDTHMASEHASAAKDIYWNDSTFDRVDRLKNLAKESGYSMVELSLAWALSRPAVTSLVVGASRPEQVVSNAASVDIKLSDDELEKLDAI